MFRTKRQNDTMATSLERVTQIGRRGGGEPLTYIFLPTKGVLTILGRGKVTSYMTKLAAGKNKKEVEPN